MTSLYERHHTHESFDRRIGRIGGEQHGIITRAQALACGATRAAIEWRLRVGRWEWLYPSVYRLAGTTETWRQLVLATCLHFGDGTALSHRSALVMRGMTRFDQGRAELTVRRNRNRRPVGPLEVTLHSAPKGIPTDDVIAIDGIPVTKPARTLLDLAAVESPDVVEQCLDECLRRRLVSLPFLERWLQDAIPRRRRGAPVLRRLVDARAVVGITDSPLEASVLRVLRGAGLPLPMLQYVVNDEDRFVGRLDFAYPAQRVAIEADGFRYHEGRRAFDHDRTRGNELLTLGWRVLRVTARHLQEHPEQVEAWVRRALGR